MTKHDTWASVTDSCFFKAATIFFEKERIPLRDPFPFPLKSYNKFTFDFYQIDTERLAATQYMALKKLYKSHMKSSDEGIVRIIESNNVFCVHMNDICRKFYGAEGYQRMVEFLDFTKKNPELDINKYIAFCDDQKTRWIDGDEEPKSLRKILRSTIQDLNILN